MPLSETTVVTLNPRMDSHHQQCIQDNSTQETTVQAWWKITKTLTTTKMVVDKRILIIGVVVNRMWQVTRQDPVVT